MIDIDLLGKEFYYKRDPQSFRNLYIPLRPFLINWASKKYPGDRQKIIDIVDSSLEKVYTKIDQYNPKMKFQNWIFQIISNDYKRNYNLFHQFIQFSDPPAYLEKYLDQSEYIDDTPDIILHAKIQNFLKDPSIENILGKYYQFRAQMFLEYVNEPKATYEEIAKRHNLKKERVVKYFMEIKRTLFNQFKDQMKDREPNYQINPYNYLRIDVSIN